MLLRRPLCQGDNARRDPSPDPGAPSDSSDTPGGARYADPTGPRRESWRMNWINGLHLASGAESVDCLYGPPHSPATDGSLCWSSHRHGSTDPCGRTVTLTAADVVIPFPPMPPAA